MEREGSVTLVRSVPRTKAEIEISIENYEREKQRDIRYQVEDDVADSVARIMVDE